MTVKTDAIAIIVMVSFMGSITGILFFAGSDFPQRTAPIPSEDAFDTSYWNITDAYSSPIDLNEHSIDTVDFEYQNLTTTLQEWYFDYSSEVFRGSEIRINSVIIRRSNLSEPSPAILYLHGYGERYLDYMQMLREFAAAGFVAMGIDQPGSGGSTGFPKLSPLTFLNVSSGPEDSSLYHSVWASARALTLLEFLPFVMTNATIVAGNSMGGLVTFLLSAIDDRVDASVPMISGGNLKNSITSGSLINSVIVPSYHVNSENMNNIIKWFDPLAYARLLTKPVFLLFGTDDQFFPIISLMDTIQAIHADMTLNIVPNSGHAVLSHWSYEIIRWVDQHFRNGKELPEVDVQYRNEVSVQGTAITVNVDAENTESVFLCWRTSEPGAVWFFIELPKATKAISDTFVGTIAPVNIGKVLFFVVAIQDDTMRITSRIFTSTAGSYFFPYLLIVSSVCILLIVHYKIWEPNKIHFVREVPYIIGILTLTAGFLLPLYTISGRASLSVLGFIELYGETFFVSGWFLPTILIGLCFVIALSAFRHRFLFRYVFSIWQPLLVTTVILYLVFSGIFTYFGSLFLISTGVGAIPLIVAIPLMQVLDRYLRHHTHICDT